MPSSPFVRTGQVITALLAAGALVLGTVSLTGHLTPSADNSTDIGSAILRFANSWAVTSNATTTNAATANITNGNITNTVGTNLNVVTANATTTNSTNVSATNSTSTNLVSTNSTSSFIGVTGSVSTTQLVLGGGTAITKFISTTATINPDNITANGSTTTVVTLSGVSAGDVLFLGLPTEWENTTSSVRVTAYAGTNQATIKFYNSASSSAFDLLSGTIRVSAIK